MSQASNNLAAYIWSLADLLRGDFRQSQYELGHLLPPGKRTIELSHYPEQDLP